MITATGHPNIQALHKTTLEFTKDPEVSHTGDCIVAVNAQFDYEELRSLCQEYEHARILITANDIKEEITGKLNPSFCDDEEIVIRKTDFLSDRTFMTEANKAAADLSSKLKEELRKPSTKITIEVEPN